MNQYAVSSDDCLVLLAIRNSNSLREAARRLDCDPGGLLRKVQRLAGHHDVLQKSRGKWLLTDKGLGLVAWTQETIQSQKKILLEKSVVRIASSSWFAERVLIPAAANLKNSMKNTKLELSVPEAGFEKALLAGDCDFVIACHPPENPAIGHKRVAPERWALVVSASLAKKHFSGKKVSLVHLASLPFIRHHGINPFSLLPPLTSEDSLSFVSMDNLIGVRAAVVNGMGWSFVPVALLNAEIDSGRVLTMEGGATMDRNVCLWWLRSSLESKKKVALMEDWLRRSCAKV